MKTLLCAAIYAVLLSGCGVMVSTPDELKKSVKVDMGSTDCRGCQNIKTFTTGTVASGIYAHKDSNGVRTGARLGASLALVISNAGGGFSGPVNISDERIAYAKKLTGNGHLFDGKNYSVPQYPYRFLVKVHHNSSFSDQPIYLVISDDNYQLIPPFVINGQQPNRSCFNSGCTWDEDYAIPATVINGLIGKHQPLKLFVGNRVKVQIKSIDGYNKSYKISNDGLHLEVPASYLKAFVDQVEVMLASQ